MTTFRGHGLFSKADETGEEKINLLSLRAYVRKPFLPYEYVDCVEYSKQVSMKISLLRK